jgi:hypothetical protein
MDTPQSRPRINCTDYWSFFEADNFRKFAKKTGYACWAGLKRKSFLEVAADLIVDLFGVEVIENVDKYFGPSDDGPSRFLVMNTKQLSELIRFMMDYVILAEPEKYKGAQELRNRPSVPGKNVNS